MHMDNSGPFRPGDLPIVDGKVYHLALSPEQFSPDIIIVGDPARAEGLAAEFFEKTLHTTMHRGLFSALGVVRGTGQRVLITTSGMGTSSLEIVLNELVALNEIDFASVTRKRRFPKINIIRVGTSGAIRESTVPGTVIVTEWSVGLDGTGLAYQTHESPDARELESVVAEALLAKTADDARFRGAIRPYATRVSPQVSGLLAQGCQKYSVAYQVGITVSAGGFFGNQGRDISRVPLTVPDLDRVFANLAPRQGQFLNFEMEGSFLHLFMNALGYNAGTICVAIANRHADTFAFDYGAVVKRAAEAAIYALQELRLRCDSGAEGA
jgi:uridine phosphorylase